MVKCTPLSCAWLLVALFVAVPETAWAYDVEGATRERPLYGLAMAGAYVFAPMAGLASAAMLGAEAGATVFLLTPPIVHLAYADPWWAVASLLAPSVSVLSTAVVAMGISQCDLGILGSGTCGPPMLGGAVLGYLAWAVFDVTMSSLRSRARLHDNSKRLPEPVHEPRTPAPPPTASVGQCIIERRHG